MNWRSSVNALKRALRLSPSLAGLKVGISRPELR